MSYDNIVLKAENINIGYMKGGKVQKLVHENISFELNKGEIISLIGPNGVGKSTLLRSISGTQNIIKGKISLNGNDIHKIKHHEISKQISLVLTERGFAESLKVHEVVALGRYPYTGFFGRLTNTDQEIIDKAIIDCGILEIRDSFFSDLSDGERQKTMIAKALTQEADLIILDEPTSFLDIISRIEIIELLRRLAKEHNKTILLSTHDLEQALTSSDKLMLLSKTEGLKIGIPEDFIFNGELNKLFSRNNISFDAKNGNFTLLLNTENKVYIEGDNSLIRWMTNLMNRLGFIVTDDINKAEISIYLENHNNISVTFIDYNQTLSLETFNDVKDIILKYKKKGI